MNDPDSSLSAPVARLRAGHLRKVSESCEVPGSRPQKPPAAAGWRSWGQASPRDPKGWPRPVAVRRPAVGGGVVAAPHLVELRPRLKPGASGCPSFVSPASLPRDGLGAELCLQNQVLRDLVPHPDPAAATHHSDARQGQLRLSAARRNPGAQCPITGTEFREH